MLFRSINHFPWIFSTSLVLPQASCRVRLSARDENQRPQEAPPLPPRAWGLFVATRQGCHPAGRASCLAAHRQMAGRGLGSDTTCEPRGARRRRGTCPLPEALPRTVPDAFTLLPGDLMLGAESRRLVSMPGKFCGQRSLASYSPWVCKELDMSSGLSTKRLKIA